MNITDMLEFHAASRPEAHCIFHGNRYWNYQEAFRMMCNLSSLLLMEGFKAGDVAVLAFSNELRHFMAVLATARIGATAFSITDPHSLAREMDMMRRIKPTHLITDQPGFDLPGTRKVLITAGTLSTELPEACPKEEKPSFPWLIVSGSGTTGSPKNMCYTHAQHVGRMSLYEKFFAATPSDHVACSTSMRFTGGKTTNLAALHFGACAHLNAGNQFFSEHITVLMATVFHISKLLESRQSQPARPHSLKAIILGGSTISMALRDAIHKQLTPNLYIMYSSNESGPSCVTVPSETANTPGTVGRPLKGAEVQVVGSDGKPLAPGYRGNIRVRTPSLVEGYLDDDESTRNVFRDGWFYTGDLGFFTPDGQLVHLGRADSMMIMNGINIYPAEIEQVMASHPDVVDALAMPLKHPTHQHIPICLVQLRPGSGATETVLTEFGFRNLGAACPRRVLIVDAIPRNAQGKATYTEVTALVQEMLRANPDGPAVLPLPLRPKTRKIHNFKGS